MAFCSSRLAANNYITVTGKDTKVTTLQPNEDVRVLLVRADLSEGEIKPRDRATYMTTLTKSGQIYCPVDVRDKLDLEEGDLVRYVIIPADEIPGVSDGPIRSRLRQVFSGVEREDEPKFEEQDRPTRETETATFNATMENSGQVTIKEKYMDALGLIRGDTVDVIVKNPETGEAEDMSLQIGTGNRVTVNIEEREMLGLEEPNRPEVQMLVMVPNSVPEA